MNSADFNVNRYESSRTHGLRARAREREIERKRCTDQL
jgi:hypothetical protein